METLYNQTNSLIQQTQQCFSNLEIKGVDPIQIEAEIQEKITIINRNCDKLDSMLFKVPVNQRPNAKMRCDQLKYDSRHLQAALAASQQKRARKELLASEKEQLLNRRFTPNPDATTINLDYAIQQQSGMQRAHKGMDEMLDTGSIALENLRSQRNTLKGAQRRIIDMANTLGLSNHTMRLIEKRVSEDKFILFGGMVVTLLVIVLVIVYFT